MKHQYCHWRVSSCISAGGHGVGDLVLHPGWELASATGAITRGHDIALLRLRRPLTLSARVWPACLPGTDINISMIFRGTQYLNNAPAIAFSLLKVPTSELVLSLSHFKILLIKTIL